MIFKFILFANLCYFLSVVQGLNDYTLTSIAKQYMFIDDLMEISISNLQISESEEMKPPIMMISVMIEKTMGYEIDPFFPFFKEKQPVLDLDAASNNEKFVRSPNTVAFKIDFENKTLVAMPSQSLVHVYPNKRSIGISNSNRRNETDNIIQLTTSKVDGTSFYNFSFVIFIDFESSGLYKIDLHSFHHVNMDLKVSMPWHSVSVIWHCVQLVAWIVIMTLFIYKRFRTKWEDEGGLMEFWHSIFTIKYLLMKSATTMILLIFNLETRMKMNGWNIEMCHNVFIIFSCTFPIMFACLFFVRYWNEPKENKYMRIQNVFCSIASLLMINCILQNYNTIFNSLQHLPTLVLLGHCMFFMYETTKGEYKYRVPIKDIGKRFWLRNCKFGMYFFIVCFNLVLASILSLGVPFYLYYLQTAVEDTLSVLMLLTTCQSLTYLKYIIRHLKETTGKYVVDLIPDINGVKYFTEAQGKILKESLYHALVRSEESGSLHFKYSGLYGGRYRLVCDDEKTKEWVESTIPKLDNLWENAIIKISSEPKLIKASLIIPMPAEPDVVFARIGDQNPGICTKHWQICTRTKVKFGKQLWIIKMDKQSLSALRARNYTVYSGLDKLKITKILK